MATPVSSSPWFDLVPDTLRFPALDEAVRADVAVLGGGMVGVIAAYCLAAGGRDVVLLERNHVGTGDSGFTTAFLTRVPDAAAGDLVTRYGRDFLKRLFTATADAQMFVRHTVSEHGISCDFAPCRSFNGSYAPGLAGLAEEWHALEGADPGMRFLRGADVPDVARPFVESIVIENEARFHVRQFLFGLIKAAGARLRVFEQSEVQSVEVGERVAMTTTGGSVDARMLIAASGGPVPLFPELAPLVHAKVTYALAARFPDGAPFADHLFWDCDEPYQYFRRLDDRTVIVGGADRDASAPRGGDDPHEILINFVRQRLGGTFDVSHRWAGSLFETDDGLPYVAAHPHYAGRVLFATGLSGNGMVMGALAGRLLASLASGSAAGDAGTLFALARTGATVAAPEPKTAGGGAVPAGAASFQTLAKLDQVKQGHAFCAKAGKTEIAIVNVGGQIHAIANLCTHQEGPMCEGTLEGAVLECPWHGSQFDVTTGAVVAGPARTPLAVYETRVVDGQIEVKVP